MVLDGSITWRWRARSDAAEPEAAVAWGEAAGRLHARLAQLPAGQMERLSASASRDLLIATGRAEHLPWVPGIAYAAPHAEAPALWLPTLLEPDLPCDLLARALRLQHRRQPLLLWPEPEAVVPLDRQLSVSPALLARIHAHWQA
ncbi:MAG TPA: hypothetical protein VEB23_02655 [Ramlibacter sp.]|nr:hypothetical protein [Ramlibacter sp.]